jgi:hypothetical protein
MRNRKDCTELLGYLDNVLLEERVSENKKNKRSLSLNLSRDNLTLARAWASHVHLRVDERSVCRWSP